MKTFFATAALLLVCLSLSVRPARCQIAGGPYLGQSLPGVIPEPFAQAILPTSSPAITFTPEGLECFFQYLSPDFESWLMTSREAGGTWPDPDTVTFSGPLDSRPRLTPDGNRLLFISQRETPGYPGTHLWYSDRVETGWEEPVPMGSPVKEHVIDCASAALNGNLYYSDEGLNNAKIYLSRLLNGNYTEPELLGDSIHISDWAGTPFISPDESYLLFCAGAAFSPGDLYISYRKPDQTWTTAVSLSDTINTGDDEALPFVSGDGQLLFFTRNGIVFWMAKPGIVTGISGKNEPVMTTRLDQNFPNPFSETTAIAFTLSRRDHVTLTIHDMLKKRVALLVSGMMPAGKNEVTFNAGDLPAGMYECVLTTQNMVLTRKMICTR